MKLQHTMIENLNQFSGYGDDFVRVNAEQYQGNVLVTASEVHVWRPVDFEDLTEDDFSAVLAYKPEVVLLGTGKSIRFPHPRLYRALAAAHIGLDVMDTGALCRTFNILTSEDRKVVAMIVHN
ncbi:MAG: Mth938-like domain-containing protein [Burkholderiales bacterium]|nr:Mth938-like domain-containing protein [Burkholderiales bacterium]